MPRKNLTEKEIDHLVITQADDDSAWDKPIRARKAKPASLSIPPELAARTAFLAQLHRTKNMEEAAFVGVKQDLTSKIA